MMNKVQYPYVIGDGFGMKNTPQKIDINQIDEKKIIIH